MGMTIDEERRASYGIVTSARDELPYLSTLFASIRTQDWRPAIWIIIDDGSTDGSAEALERASSAVPEVVVTHRESQTRDRGSHLASVLRAGVEHGQQEASRRNLLIDYWAVVDADVVLPQHYFSTLRKAFEADPKLGICSGQAQYGDRFRHWRRFLDFSDEPAGAARLSRATCLDEIGGVPEIELWDVVSNALATVHGWRLRRLWELRFQTRRRFQREGLWEMQSRYGEQTARFGYPFTLALARAIRLLAGRNAPFAAPFLARYLQARTHPSPPLVPPDLIAYFRGKNAAAIVRARLASRTHPLALPNFG